MKAALSSLASSMAHSAAGGFVLPRAIKRAAFLDRQAFSLEQGRSYIQVLCGKGADGITASNLAEGALGGDLYKQHPRLTARVAGVQT